MKTRLGFVSNSSTSSFTGIGWCLDNATDLKEIFIYLFNNSPEIFSDETNAYLKFDFKGEDESRNIASLDDIEAIFSESYEDDIDEYLTYFLREYDIDYCVRECDDIDLSLSVDFEGKTIDGLREKLNNIDNKFKNNKILKACQLIFGHQPIFFEVINEDR